MEPYIYIILINYNSENDTIRCIQSLSELTYPNYHVIVVDNDSKSESWESISRYLEEHREITWITAIKCKENLGFSGGNNIGIKYALDQSADFILLLNNDTIVTPDFLSELVSQYKPGTGIAIGKILYSEEKNRIWYAGGSLNRYIARTRHWNYGNTDNNNDHSVLKVSFATGCCMLISAAVIEKVGYLDERFFLYWEDADYSVRMLKANLDILYVPTSVIYHNVSASTGKGSRLVQYYQLRNELIYIKKNISMLFRPFAYGYSLMKLIYHLYQKKIFADIAVKAVKDYMCHIDGKVDTI